MQDDNSSDPISGLLKLAAIAPAPMNVWINGIAMNSWRAMLETSQVYLNQAWETQVLPEYQALIRDRYPIFKNSSQDVSLVAFGHFFAPTGTLNRFFENYLRSFVDTHDPYWVWKARDGQHLNIPQHTLDMFIRAALIHQMFFINTQTIPSTHFVLSPLMNDLGSGELILDMNGTEISSMPKNHAEDRVSWPNGSTKQARILWRQSNLTRILLRESGPWAAFRLLDQIDLQPTPNAKLYKLSLLENGRAVNFELIAEGVVNPFIPEVITSFRCPDHL